MLVQVWDLVTFVRGKVGCGYVWGASGETCSLSVRQGLAKRAPAQATSILGLCAKWDGRQVFDCATLIREAFKAAGIKKGSGATTIWKTWHFSERGTIDTLPVGEPGIALFRAENAAATSMGHIGMTIGDGLAVDCRGSAAGVVVGAVASHKWTHWGRFGDVDYAAARPALPVLLAGLVATKSGALNLRAWPDAKSQVLGKLPKGAELPVYRDGQTNADWLKVYFLGGPAYAMEKYVSVVGTAPEKLPAEEPEKRPAEEPVTLRTLRYVPGLPFMRGEDVALLQARLAAQGLSLGASGADGVYGPKTKAAVLAFQLDAFPGQPGEWDGVAGPKTWAKLGA